MKKALPIILAAVILVGGLSFFGGMKYGQSRASAVSGNMNNFRQGAVQGFSSSTMLGGRNIVGGLNSGKIIAKDDQSITVKTQDGSSKIIFYSGATEIIKSSAGTASDLSVGDNISVTGAENQDGSITAKSIQVRPEDQPAEPVL